MIMMIMMMGMPHGQEHDHEGWPCVRDMQIIVHHPSAKPTRSNWLQLSTMGLAYLFENQQAAQPGTIAERASQSGDEIACRGPADSSWRVREPGDGGRHILDGDVEVSHGIDHLALYSFEDVVLRIG